MEIQSKEFGLLCQYIWEEYHRPGHIIEISSPTEYGEVKIVWTDSMGKHSMYRTIGDLMKNGSIEIPVDRLHGDVPQPGDLLEDVYSGRLLMILPHRLNTADGLIDRDEDGVERMQFHVQVLAEGISRSPTLFQFCS